MVKIKTTKQLNLPQLIEYAWANEVSNKAFYSNCSGGSAFFDDEQILFLEHETHKDETFAVEIAEEITEDTVFPVLVKTFKNVVKEIKVRTFYNSSINSSKSYNETISYHILNDDGTMTLLWKDGAMIDD